MPQNGIRDVQFQWAPSGKVESLRVLFGPHYFLELRVTEGETVAILGYTHHGIRAKATEVNDQLEKAINALMENHPDLVSTF